MRDEYRVDENTPLIKLAAKLLAEPHHVITLVNF